MFKLWDQLAGSTYKAAPESCICAACCQSRGERTVEAWEAVEKPNYSDLLELSFWLRGDKEAPPSVVIRSSDPVARVSSSALKI